MSIFPIDKNVPVPALNVRQMVGGVRCWRIA